MPAHHRRAQSLDARARLGERTDQSAGPDRLTFALDGNSDRLGESERTLRHQGGTLSNQHGSRLGRRLKTGGDIHGVPGDEPLVEPVLGGGQHLARIHADPNLQ